MKSIPQPTINSAERYNCFTDQLRLKCLMLGQYKGPLRLSELMAMLKVIRS
jgi:hypothetical protein